MKCILPIFLFIITINAKSQPGDPELLIHAEQQRKVELTQKLENDPHNPELLYQKVFQDLRRLSIDLYSKPNNNQFALLTSEMSETEAQLNELISLQPNNAQLYLLRGNYQYFYGDVYNTVEDFEMALELSIDHSFRMEVFHKLSLCHYHIGICQEPFDLEKSLVFIDSANLISENRNEPFARTKIYLLKLAKKEDELLSYYKTLSIKNLNTCLEEKVSKLYRFDDNFLEALGYLYEAADYQFRNKKFKNAIEIVEICINTTPQNSAGQAMPNHLIIKCHYLLSKIYREPAVDDYEKALEHIILALDEPTSWLLEEHELQKDLDYFLQSSSDNPDLLIAKAIYYFKMAWQGSRSKEDILSKQIDPLLEMARMRGSQSYKIPLILSIRNLVYKHHDQALFYAKDAVELAPDNYHCQAALFEALRNIPDTEEHVFQEIKKKIDILYYDKKPYFDKIIGRILDL